MRLEMKIRFSLWTVALLVLASVLLGMEVNNLFSGDRLDMQMKKFGDVLSLTVKYYVDEVDTQKLTEAAITGLLDELDPHSVYIPAKAFEQVEEDFRGKFEGIGIQFRVLNDTITVMEAIGGGPSAKLGILSNDKIVQIDNKSAIGFTNDQVRDHLRGPKGTRVTVTIVRTGEPEALVYEITRDEIPLLSVDAAIMTDGNVGYVRVNRFNEQTSKEMSDALQKLKDQGMKKLVLDLRVNPGGYLEEAVRMSDLFLTGGAPGKPRTIVYTKGRRPEIEETWEAKSGDPYENLPLIIMISNISASASEIVAGAIQDWDRGLIVGETSFGKGLVQRQFKLADGSALRLTISKYYTPSGRLIQRSYEGKDKLAYQNEAYQRNEQEGDNLEHTADTNGRADSARPQFSTNAGRTVYGGGGITPDYIVKPDTVTSFTASLRRRDLFSAFVVQYLDGPGFELRKTYGSDFKKFRSSYAVSNAMMDDFRTFVVSKGVTIDEKGFKTDRDYIVATLKANVAKAFFGTEAEFPFYLDLDKQFQKALSLFPEAERIAGL
jgi:carboxyl-terminal processing protease